MLEKFGFKKETEEFLKEYFKDCNVPDEKFPMIVSYFRMRVLLVLVCGYALGLLTFMFFLEIIAYFG